MKRSSAGVHVEVSGDVFEIDVRQNGDREVYQLKDSSRDELQAEVLDVEPRLRHAEWILSSTTCFEILNHHFRPPRLPAGFLGAGPALASPAMRNKSVAKAM